MLVPHPHPFGINKFWWNLMFVREPQMILITAKIEARAGGMLSWEHGASEIETRLFNNQEATEDQSVIW